MVSLGLVTVMLNRVKGMLYLTNNGDEGSMFAPASVTAPLGLEKYIKALFPALVQEDVEKAVELYGGSDADAASAASKVMGDGAW